MNFNFPSVDTIQITGQFFDSFDVFVLVEFFIILKLNSIFNIKINAKIDFLTFSSSKIKFGLMLSISR